MQELVTHQMPEALVEQLTVFHQRLGLLLMILVVAAMAEVLQPALVERFRFFWPSVCLIVCMFLFGWVSYQRWRYDELVGLIDPDRNAHEMIAGSFVIGALGEILYRRRPEGAAGHLGLLWPLFLVTAGMMFVAHDQPGLRMQVVHWTTAGTLVLAGLIQLSLHLAAEESRPLRILSLFLVLMTAFQLSAYEERADSHALEKGPSGTKRLDPVERPR